MILRIFNILLEPDFLSAESETYTVDVKSADTVWSIAEICVIFLIEQMMMAIYRLNPDSYFYDSNVNRLKNGTQLLIPDISTIEVLLKPFTKKLFRKQYEQETR